MKRIHATFSGLRRRLHSRKSLRDFAGWVTSEVGVVATALLLAVVVGVAPLIVTANTGLGYVADDWVQLCAMRGCSYTGGPTPDNLFRFISGDAELTRAAMTEGALPWYTDPEAKNNFRRPLSTLLHRVDFRLFGGALLPAKLHSFAWYLLLVGVVSRLYQLLSSRHVALLAAAIFAIAASHFQIATWVASRNATIAATLSLSALLIVVTGDRSGRRLSWLAALPFYLASLTAGESAIGGLLYLLAYELFRPIDDRRVARWPRSVAFIAVTLVWLAAYGLQGFGSRNLGEYLDPLHQPSAVFSELPARVIALLGMGYLGFPADTWLLKPNLKPSSIAVGALALVLLPVCIRAVWSVLAATERRVLLWAATASCCALIPQAAGLVSARSLALPSVGICVVVAHLMAGALRRWRLRRAAASSPYLHATMVLALSVIHLVLAPASWVISTVVFYQTLTGVRRATAAVLDRSSDRTAILLQAPDLFFTHYLVFERRARSQPAPRAWHTLSLVRTAHRVHRTSPSSFELEFVDGHLLTTPAERLRRSPERPLRLHDVVDLGPVQAEITQADDVGPTRVAFRFAKRLEDLDVSFFAWRDGKLEPFEFPVLGQVTTLPWSSPPWAL